MHYSDNIRKVFGGRADGSPLFSFWTHFPEHDQDAEDLAEATVRFQQTFDLDFVKTAPNGMYAIEDFGVELDFSELPKGGVARVVSTPFETAADWHNLPEPDIASGAFARELRSLELVRAALPDTPILFTVFSPMTIAAKLSRGRIHTQIKAGGDRKSIHLALERLSRTVRLYSEAAIASGAEGVFFAHQDTGRSLLTYDDFVEFVAEYDLEALAGARHGRFNILHVHGTHTRFREVQDYPVHALNWHDHETRPSALAGLLASGKCVVGGIDRWSVTKNDIPAIQAQVASVLDAAAELGDVILAPSCTIRAGFDPDTIHAARAFIKDRAAATVRSPATQELEVE